MKTLYFVLAFFVTGLFYGQSVLDTFENQDDVTAIVVNKKMFDLIGKVETNSKDTQEFLALAKKLEILKVFITSNTSKASELKKASEKLLKSSNLSQLTRVREQVGEVEVFVKTDEANSNFKELMMFVDGASNQQSLLMYLKGDFSLSEISVLTNKLKLPGGAILSKASKK
jgi:cysteinyl-tRNA synthetase